MKAKEFIFDENQTFNRKQVFWKNTISFWAVLLPEAGVSLQTKWLRLQAPVGFKRNQPLTCPCCILILKAMTTHTPKPSSFASSVQVAQRRLKFFKGRRQLNEVLYLSASLITEFLHHLLSFEKKSQSSCFQSKPDSLTPVKRPVENTTCPWPQPDTTYFRHALWDGAVPLLCSAPWRCFTVSPDLHGKGPRLRGSLLSLSLL